MYKQLSTTEVTEINGTIYEYEHEKTGARIIYIKTEDDNKVFMIGFRTPPTNDTGVAHIMEHSVLCGSKKYPLPDPFVELVKGSLNTFINAITYPDKTVYPVASRNNQDFKNLMDVYLDAVFNPLIYVDEGIFKQEGWHYEEDGISGVVYNEMKGALSTPEAKLDSLVSRTMFPDNCYKYESGGDPKSIPNLTYNDFIQFHKEHYHPSNAIVYMYGDMDIDERLEYLDREYLSKYDKIEVHTDIISQKLFTAPVKAEGEYPISEGEDIKNKTFLSLNFLMDLDSPDNDRLFTENISNELKHRTIFLAMQVLLKTIIENEAAPLRKAIIDAGLGKDVDSNFDADLKQPTISIVLNGSEAKHANKFKEIVFNKLTELAKNIDKIKLEASLNTIEFALRESDFGAMPKGLIYGLSLLRSALYGGKADTFLRYEDTLQLVKKEMHNGLFEKIVDKFLLSNKHCAEVMLKPAVMKPVEKIKPTPEQLAQSKKTTASPYTDNLEVIPLLQLSDIKKEVDRLPIKYRDLDGVRIVHSNVQTNGIIYLRMFLDASKLPQNLRLPAAMFVDMLGRVDTKNYTYEELNNEINLNLGSFGLNLGAHTKAGKPDSFMPKLLVFSKVLASKQHKLSELIIEILTNSVFTDKKRLKELIEEDQINLEMSMERAAHQVVSARLSARNSKSSAYNNENFIAMNNYMKDLLDNFDAKYDKLLDDFEEAKQRLINRNGILVGVTADDDVYREFVPHLSRLLKSLPVDEFDDERYYYPTNKDKEAISSQSMVQYVGKGANFINLGYNFTGAMLVLETILRYEYLWKAIRVEGGAYGAFANFHRDGQMILESYRDPNLKRTLDVFDGTADFLKNMKLNEREMRKYIIGTISKMDTPKTPAMKGAAAIASVIQDVSYEERQRTRDEVLATTQEDIHKLAEIVAKCMAENNVCVFGNEKVIKDNSNLFDKVIKIK